MDWGKDLLWLVWIGAALVGGVLEIASLDFVFAMLAGGALAAAGAALLGASLTWQVITFAGTASVLLVTVRPAVKKWTARNAPFIPTNVHALRGRRAETLSEVTSRGGTVKLTGETWSARTALAGLVIPPDTPVQVVEIDGATAVVEPLPSAEPPTGPTDSPGTEH